MSRKTENGELYSKTTTKQTARSTKTLFLLRLLDVLDLHAGLVFHLHLLRAAPSEGRLAPPVHERFLLLLVDRFQGASSKRCGVRLVVLDRELKIQRPFAQWVHPNDRLLTSNADAKS